MSTQRIAQAQRVSSAFGLTEDEALRMPEKVLAVLDRQAARLDFIDTNTQQEGEEDGPEVRAW
jgi:hypothetical protein